MKETLQNKIKGIMVPKSMQKNSDEIKEDEIHGVLDHRKIINRES
jgi:hypothetical protein